MSFLVYDIGLFILFSLALAIFFHQKRKNFKIDGPLYLYRTKFGLKLIDWFGDKHANVLRPLQYLVLTSGYALLIFMIYLTIKIAYIYITSPYLAKALKVPVIFPLLPYLPEIFKIDFLPPFYFTYWIVIIAIIAIPHEFAHGIFARLNKVKIHSTGFGFLRIFKLPTPFLAAFVEQDDKQMGKASKFAQLSILAAGTFANVLMTILFGLIMWLFFVTAFSPAGVYFNTYSTSVINGTDIYSIDNHTLSVINADINVLNMSKDFVQISANNKSYYTSPMIIKEFLNSKLNYLVVYEDAPAINARLSGAIVSVDNKPITSYDEVRSIILSHKPGDTINIRTMDDENNAKDYSITLANRDGRAFLGIGINPVKPTGIMGSIFNIIAKIKDPFIYYQSSLGDLGLFIYDLLWWIVIVNISVALTNMLPVGIFDGGRFFMLTVWGLTGSKRAGEIAFKASTYLILAVLALLMIKWVWAVFL